MKILEMLFSTTNSLEKGDGLQQEEREALIDLLLYCEFADNHLSLAEDKVLQDEAAQFNWDSGVDIDNYISSAISRVRTARTNKLEAGFLKNATSRLQSSYAKATARSLMVTLFRSDGEVDAEKVLAETVLLYLQ